jgi:hypothetical protein
MITRSRIISGKRFTASCADALQPHAEWLLSLFERIEKERGSGFLEDGARIQVGWSLLSIRREGDALVIVEPDFSGNPFETSRADLTTTLSVQAQQNDVLTALGLPGTAVSFRDKIVFAKGCLDQPHIYLERQAPKPGDSGWFIGEVKKPQSELAAIYVYQLLKIRPEILKVLALPVGYVVVFRDTAIEAVLNDKNQPMELKS